MSTNKIIVKLENDLSQFLIQEICKRNPDKRDTSDTFKYKGLEISADTKSKNFTKTIKIRIGIMEAEFKLGTLEKVSGNLSDEEERLIQMWMSNKENGWYLRKIFMENRGIKSVSIMPFDLEEYYRNNT